MKSSRLILSAVFAAMLGVSLISCSGGGDSSLPLPTEPETTTIIAYQNGDLIDDTVYLPPVYDSFRQTIGAMVQAVLAVNTFIFTDPAVTDLTTFEARKAQADQALNSLIVLAEKTEMYADLIPAAEATFLSAERLAAIAPSEIEAILASSQSKWPIKTLMQHYKVNAQQAKVILDDAMAGLVSTYTQRADFLTKAILVAQVVKDTSALTVTIGSAVATAGGVTGALGLIDATMTIISGADAAIKLGKAGAELYIGEDGKLDDTFKNSVILSTVSDLNEVVSVASFKGLTLPKPSTFDKVSSFVYLLDKTLGTYPAKILTTLTDNVVAEIIPEENIPIVINNLNTLPPAVPIAYPGQYTLSDGTSFVIDALQGISGVFAETLSMLPVEHQTEATKAVFAPDVDTYTFATIFSWDAYPNPQFCSLTAPSTTIPLPVGIWPEGGSYNVSVVANLDVFCRYYPSKSIAYESVVIKYTDPIVQRQAKWSEVGEMLWCSGTDEKSLVKFCK